MICSLLLVLLLLGDYGATGVLGVGDDSCCYLCLVKWSGVEWNATMPGFDDSIKVREFISYNIVLLSVVYL